MPDQSFAIVDDFLDEAEWTALWTEFQYLELHPVSRTVGAWKLEDGVPLGGHEIVTPARNTELNHDPENPDRYPSDTAVDAVITNLLAEQAVFSGVVDEGWERISARPYIYPQGTGLSWHRDDSKLFAGAFIYYAHPHWNAHWGGELLIAEETSAELSIMGHRFETEDYSEALMKGGLGRFIMPKPNRLVILGGAPHAVAPVTTAAGHNVRASISGFFLRG